MGRGEPIDRRVNNSGMLLGVGFNSQWADEQQAGGQVRASEVFSCRVIVCFLDVGKERRAGSFQASGLIKD